MIFRSDMALRLTNEQKEILIKRLDSGKDDGYSVVEVNGVPFRIERGEEEDLVGLIEEHGQAQIKIVTPNKFSKIKK